jgi:hypothetical protein
MYDSFQPRMKDNITDKDLLMESKIKTGHGSNPYCGSRDIHGNADNSKFQAEVVQYMKNQRPINATDFTNPQQLEDLFTRHLSPSSINNINAHLGDVNQYLTLANTN